MKGFIAAHVIPGSKNPHQVQVKDIAQACPWCDGTGKFCRSWTAARNMEWVDCGQCEGTGQRKDPDGF